MTMPSPHADFLAAFRARRAHCRALLELTMEQRALIATDDYTQLLRLLSHKQQVLDALLSVGREPVDVWGAWRSERERVPQPLRAECERTLAETEELLSQLLAQEQTCTAYLADRRHATESALCALNHGSAAQAGYGGHERRSRRLDVGS